jgi:uncharacterized protein (TIGR02996 family)
MVVRAQTLADVRLHAEVDPLHLLSQVLEHGGDNVRLIFIFAGIDLVLFREAIDAELGRVPSMAAGSASYLSPRMRELLSRVEKKRHGARGRDQPVGIGDLLNGLVQEIRGPIAPVLDRFGLGPGSLRRHIDDILNPPCIPSDSEISEIERGFLVTIQTSSVATDVDDARAVYADWLDERGRANEAKMLRAANQIRAVVEGRERAPTHRTPSLENLKERIRARFSQVPPWWYRIAMRDTGVL